MKPGFPLHRGHELSQTRNIGIAAHVDAGKTTLTERILFYTGASHKIGEVHDGAAHMDYLFEEQSHGITITSAVTRVIWNDCLIQIIDTPGHVDFTMEVDRAMRVIDGCIIVLDCVRGVEPQTETIWRQRQKFGLPCLFFINKTDRPGADFRRCLDSMRQRLQAEPVPITVPIPEQEGIVHLIEKTLIRFGGDQGEIVQREKCDNFIWESVAEFHENLMLAIAEVDETLADLVLEGRRPSEEAIWTALRHGTLSGKLHACFGGSALRNRGIQPLLDAILRLLPTPLNRPASSAIRADGQEEIVIMGDDGPLVALVFKVQMWEGRRFVFARIYRNELRPGDQVVFMQADGKIAKEQVARVFDVDAHRRTHLEKGIAGQIVLLAGLRRATTGDTLCDPKHPLALERIDYQEPVLSLAIEPYSSEDEDKFLDVMGKLQQEDPTIRLEIDPNTGQRLLRGMGEFHLQIVLERLEREFQLKARTGKPAVALRETVSRSASADILFQTPLDPAKKIQEMKARVSINVSPGRRGAGVTTSVTPSIRPPDHELSPPQKEAIYRGLRMAISSGPIEGAPLEDIEIKVAEIELFGKDSTPAALCAATENAAFSAIRKANPLILHPIITAEIVVPEENLGLVLSDLQSRRAIILETDKWKGTATITCEARLERLLGYTTNLRSMTQGRGQFSTIFNRFDQI